jgi:hypothetical protein
MSKGIVTRNSKNYPNKRKPAVFKTYREIIIPK